MLSTIKHASRTLFVVSRCAFATGSGESVKPQRKSTKPIVDLRNAIYKPVNKLEFDKEGKCLLYYYRPRFYTMPFFYSKYLGPFALFAYLIANNPFYTTFPAALPLLFYGELWLMRKLYLMKKHYRHIISEVYLLKDGETLEIVYLNKFWRKLKNDDLSNLYYIPSLTTPVVDETTKPLGGDLFPEEYPYQDLNPTGYAWSKYFRNPNNYFLLPKYANYSDWELLVAAFSGKMIEVTKQNTVEIDYDKKEKYRFE